MTVPLFWLPGLSSDGPGRWSFGPMIGNINPASIYDWHPTADATHRSALSAFNSKLDRDFTAHKNTEIRGVELPIKLL